MNDDYIDELLAMSSDRLGIFDVMVCAGAAMAIGLGTFQTAIIGGCGLVVYAVARRQCRIRKALRELEEAATDLASKVEISAPMHEGQRVVGTYGHAVLTETPVDVPNEITWTDPRYS